MANIDKTVMDEFKKKSASTGTVNSGTSTVGNGASTTSAQSNTVSNPDSVMSADDQARVEYYRGIYNDALDKGDKATMEAAHQSVEDIRAGYGYSGGVDGTQYITEGVVQPTGTHKDAGLSQESQRVVDDARLNYYVALNAGDEATMDYWHQVAENERAGYGYSGGKDGSEYIPLEQQTSAVQDYSNYLEEMYAAQKRAALAELNAAYESNLATIDRAGQGVGALYQNARNQSVGASELSKRNFAEYAAASGLNSGTGGQAELARNVALQNNLNNIDTAEADTYADLELQRAQAEIDYNNAIAQAEAEGDYELANALYQEKVRVQEALLQEQRYQDELALQQYKLQYQAQRDQVSDGQWQQSFDQSVAQQNWENALALQKYKDSLSQQSFENDLAVQKYQDSLTQDQRDLLASYGAAYLEAGVMPSGEMLTAMGITEADARAYIAAVQNANAGVGTEMNLSTAKQAAENGVFNDQVIAVLKANGYTDDMLAGIYGYESLETSGLNFARYLYSSTKNPDYVYKTLKSSGYSDTEIDGLMAQLGL